MIGAGFLGSEIAATARGLGLDVTLVDIKPTCCSGKSAPKWGSWWRDCTVTTG
ncbi:NAD-binding protein [Streptomyces sp. N2A]|uniref:NAD-binding protein n=1 Tax=Streptomyces sp. N2A TaxID=3073936 RepID=UPI00286FBBC8|nr:NAD-binding protein [Streptomyces sp. N2A]